MKTLSSIDRMLKQVVCLLALAALPFSAAQAVTYCGTPYEATLYAGQTTDAGSVTVANDANNLYVTFTTTGDWKLQQTHLHVADSLASVPQTKTGNPKIGNFKYQIIHNPLVTEYMYTIPKNALSLDANQSVVIAAHAVVVKLDSSGNVIANETGWAEGLPFTERGSWATYFSYAWQTCDNPPPVPQTSTETAFAYNDAPLGACFLSLDLDNNGTGDFNRWGWTIGPLAQGDYTFDVYAAAGKCDLSKGTYVGTLTVNYAAGTATVTYNMQGTNPMTGVAYNLVEAQLYVGNDILPKNVNGEFTVAPGQYPDVAGELKNVTSKTFVVEGLTGDIYVVAHATVAGFPL
ncbi:MAG: hypothetical protein WC856_25460 [Methylococcaceae bacterium]|jgi:hypothetical protein